VLNWTQVGDKGDDRHRFTTPGPRSGKTS
jgi:hypothetical protein